MVGITVIGNKPYQALASLVQLTNPSIVRLLNINNVMHQKVHCVNQTPRPKYVGVFILDNCFRCLTISHIISDDLDDIVWSLDQYLQWCSILVLQYLCRS
jgi:hypothetical protein